ncbi:MAG TPA: alkaline phosphatase family protein [Solirubrobacteraceae bacterium]|nr:alkaline phosphatase family protein [Solirubrobacteraceae bacterium]
MSAESPGGACSACGSQLASGQRYCLHCGERTGTRSPQLNELLRRAQGMSPGGAPTATPPRRPAAGRPSLGGALARVAALRLPSRRVSAVLVLAFLGFGVLLGNAAGSRVTYTAASARAPLKLMLPASAPTASAETGEGGAAASAEPPEIAEEPTPEATPETPAAAPAPKPAGGAGGGDGSGGGGGEGNAGGGKGESGSSPQPSSGTASKLPAIKHVFVVMLSDEPYAAVFGPESKAPYLAHTLEKRGELLARYYAIAHEQLPNGIALLSGQGPTPATAVNCPTYADVTPATAGGEGQTLGEGCVYPATTPTLPGQLEVKHQSWRAYVQGTGEAGGPPTCSHPAPGASDPTATVPAGTPGAPTGTAAAPAAPGAYATFRNPFVYFHSLADAPGCAQDDAGIAALDEDLKSAKRTPAFSYIVPDRCHDGSPGPCPGGAPGGLPAADGFLQQIVPKIVASPAYKQGGLLVITVDEAPSGGEFADSSSCCGQPAQFPNMPAPTGASAALGPAGGGQVGALLLSPYVKGGTITQEQYDHFSLLRTIEDLFGLKHLGYAGAAKVPALAPSLFAATPRKKSRK